MHKELLLICIPINLAGVLYVIFCLKEVERPKKDEIELSPGVDNPGFENVERNLQLRETQNTNGHREMSISISEPKNQPNCLLDFFNPVVAVECVKVLMRKRENKGRATVILLFAMYFIAIGPSFGEEPYCISMNIIFNNFLTLIFRFYNFFLNQDTKL